MKQQNCEQDAGQFEEFDEEYMICTQNSQVYSPSPGYAKPSTALNIQRPKLMMTHGPDRNCFVEAFNRKRKRPSVSNNSNIISIGEAIFRSNFESGNIYSALKRSPNTYEITLHKQMNSSRSSAWFYFACEGLKGENTFIIKGFTKSTSLYNSGMKICYRQALEGSEWRRGGTKISYSSSNSDDESAQSTYELQFNYFFKNTPTTVQFAYCFPFTYTNLLKFITSSNIKCESLGLTYQGRQIPLLTVGNPSSNKVIVISARTHPGETVGSLMMNGFLKQLISDSKYSLALRAGILFKIVPMVNVDGVVNGSYRFSAAGFDLNRKWKQCSEKLHPEIYQLKELIKKLQQEKEVIMFIDLHGHSRQKNVFFYGCCPKEQAQTNTKPKEFPFLMSKIHPPFRYDFCSYAVQKDKEGTGRVCMWKQLKIDYVYTMEASFCSSQGGGNYLIQDYQKIGAKLSQGICMHFWSLLEKFIQNEDGSLKEQDLAQIKSEMEKNMNEFFSNPKLAEIQFDGNSSDSQPEAGEIPIELRTKGRSQVHIRESKSVVVTKQQIKTRQKKVEIITKLTPKEESNNKRNKTNESLQLSKINQSQRVRWKSQRKNPIEHLASNRSSYTQVDILNKTITENMKVIQEKNRFPLSHFKIQAQHHAIVHPNRITTIREMKDPIAYNIKKKTNSFEGAQYRRVRKMAEEHNRHSYSNRQPEIQATKDLSAMMNLMEIERLYPRKRDLSFYPTSSHHSRRKRKTSTDFQKPWQIHGHPFGNNPSGQKRPLDIDVKCYGKQIS